MSYHPESRLVGTSKTLSLALGIGIFTGSVIGQVIDTFNTINPAWVIDRYAPAGFESVVFQDNSRLRLTIDQTGSTANRLPQYSNSFYSTQGYQRPGDIIGPWAISADVYIPSTFNTTSGQLVSGDLWGHSGTTPGAGAFMILGFTNESPSHGLDPAALDRAFSFRALDIVSGNWLYLGVPTGFIFDEWHTLSATASGNNFEYRIDGSLVLTQATLVANDLLSVMVQSNNFDQPGSYSVYWDNVTTSAVPEPACYALTISIAALGFVTWRRRRVPKKSIGYQK